MNDPQDKEDALAGVLTGALFSALGAAFPALLMWFVVTHWQPIISGHAMTSGEAFQGVGLLALSLPILGFGIRMVTVNARALRRL